MKKVYKPSNKFSLIGVIVLALAVLVSGSIISVVYLKINQINPIVYLSILLTVGVGLLIGFVAKLVIKAFKIRSVIATIVAVVIGFAGFTYFKWALYDYNDYKMIAKDLCEAEDVSSDEYKEIVDDTTKDIEDIYGGYNEFFGDILEDGTYTVKMAFYEMPVFKVSLTKILTNPKILFGDIKTINEDGRWSYSSSRSSLSDDDASLVKGPLLAIIWLAEIAIILIFVLITVIEAVKYSFIEKENKYAEKLENCFVFMPFNAKSVVNGILENPAELLNIQALEYCPVGGDFVCGTVYHSTDFTECYLSLDLHQITQNGKKQAHKKLALIKYLDISGQLTNDLFNHCHLSAPMSVSSETTSFDSSASSSIDEEMFN